MRFSVPPEDFLKGQLVEPGWHPSIITVWDEEGKAGDSAKNPGSQITKVQFKVTHGPNKGATVYAQFSEVAPSFIVPLVEAVTGQTFDKKKQVNFETSAAMMKGKYVDIHVIRGSYQNKPKNEVDGYRKYTGPLQEVPTGTL